LSADYGRFPFCTSLVGNAKPEIACYWNAVEEKVASGAPVLSPEMRKLHEGLLGMPRGFALTQGLIKDGEPLPSMASADGRKLLVFGHNFSGDLFAFDAEHNYRVVELLHEDMEVWPFKRGGFKEFIREKMLLGPDGADQRGYTLRR